jgi:metal-responsive CopG/Arc/MetJ family transcriptional regulator
MKTAVSMPDDLFAQVDRLARRSRRSRSEVYRAALREYVARHAPDEVTAGLDAVLADVGEPGADPFTSTAARRTLGATEW